jgi:hypothetical protein
MSSSPPTVFSLVIDLGPQWPSCWTFGALKTEDAGPDTVVEVMRGCQKEPITALLQPGRQLEVSAVLKRDTAPYLILSYLINHAHNSKPLGKPMACQRGCELTNRDANIAS